MIIPRHHPPEAMLLDYADGSLSEPAALTLATHLALCPECRQRVAELEAIGGALLEESVPEPVSVDCLAAILARLDDPEPRQMVAFEPLPAEVIALPQPLRSYVGMPLAGLDWKSVSPVIAEFDLQICTPPAKTGLIRLAAGCSLPRHGHGDSEVTLVLEGGYRDQFGHFQRGDLVVHDSLVEHAPLADPDGDCIFLCVLDAPIRLTSVLGRFLSPLLRH
ncbi:MAG: anti-sigma factor [Azospirillum sp.]|nr:anti-sigma factor [Azospirillum sp.]